jgi:protein SCO1/2
VKRRFLITFCLAVVAAALVVLGYLSWNASIRRDRADLPRFGMAPEFSLKDQNGSPVGKDQLRGKTWVADFFDPAEPGLNVLLGSRFAELDQNFQKGEQLTLVSFVIPSGDQNELADLPRRFLASSHWHFLVGTVNEIRDVQDRWNLIVSAQSGGDAASRSFFLVDSEGMIRGVYDGRLPETVQRVLEDIGTLLRTGAK